MYYVLHTFCLYCKKRKSIALSSYAKGDEGGEEDMKRHHLQNGESSGEITGLTSKRQS